MPRTIFAAIALLALAPIAAACNCSSGGDCHCGDSCACGATAATVMAAPSSVITTDGTHPTTVTVDVLADSFSDNVVIHVGDTVEWDWVTGFHTVTSVSASAEQFDSGFVSDGTFSHLFTQPGTFWYYCQIHGSEINNGTSAIGMAATVTVLPALPEPATISLSLIPAYALLRRRPVRQ